jgi:2-(1,2-epoxy-1,2-dihydrophenyl)acetyl-CoA isomerase
VNRVSGDGEALTDAVTMARRFAELSVSVAAIKQAHQRAFEADFTSQLDYEADTQGWLQEQPDFTEATQAFTAKRPPRLAERTPPVRTN